jgi:hypothetical protein
VTGLSCAASVVIVLTAVVIPLRAASELEVHTTRTEDPVFREGCQINLTKISDALRKYRELYNQNPNWLSDLVPEFISNRDILVCPYVRKTGRLYEWRKGLRLEPGKDPLTYYHYEFCLEKPKWFLPPDSGRSYREYKEAQMDLLGGAVPIVRCLAHSPVLNLAYNGIVFENLDSTYWEENFAHLYPHELLQPSDVFSAIRTRPDPAWPSLVFSNTVGRFHPLDLSKFLNFTLQEFPPVQRFTNHLSTLRKGLQDWDGIAFDVRGLIHLRGGPNYLPFPPEIEGITVKARCEKVHMLLGCISSAAVSNAIARVTLHFSDGAEQVMAIEYPREPVSGNPGQPGPGEGFTIKRLWNANIDWKELKTRTVCVAHASFVCAHRVAEISSIRFTSTMTEAAPFLLAITLE